MSITDLLVVVGIIAVWLLLSPCSPLSIWKSGSCAWKPKAQPPTPTDHTPIGKSMTPAITPQQVQALITAGTAIDLIDVRSPVEYARGNAVGARSVPLDDLGPFAEVARRCSPSDRPIYLICQSGGRSAQACMLFQAAGIDNVRNVTGGTSGWMAMEPPTAVSTADPRCCG